METLKEPILVHITTLSTQGEGIGRVDGKATFVPFTLPGETWSVRIVQRKGKFDRALPIERIDRNPDAPERIEPLCPYYGVCGGCHVQHLPYRDQLIRKRDWLEETFRRIAHLDIAPAEVVPSNPWEYRNRLIPVLTQDNGRIVCAFHKIHDPGTLVPIYDCPIAHPLIRKALTILPDFFNERVQASEERNKLDNCDGSVQFRVINQKLSIRFQDIPLAVLDCETLARRLEKQAIPIEPIDISAPDSRSTSGLTASAGTFLQINDEIREKLYSHVLDLPFGDSNRVLDGYCGQGELTCLLSRRFERVVGVEIDKTAVAEAKERAEKTGQPHRVRFRRRRLEDFLRDSKDRFDCIVLNPPRKGLSSQAVKQVSRKNPRELVLISCHPAALARDVQAFTEVGYEILSVQPFDMFPQTYHLEAVVHLRSREK